VLACPAVVSSSDLPTLLLVDDDETFRLRLARALHERGFEVTGAGDVPAALALARRDPPELAVVDLKLPGGTGLDLVRELKALDPATEVVVLTGYGSIATAVEAVKLGARHYLPKPADADEILQALGRSDPKVEADDAAAADIAAPSLARAEWEHIQRVLVDCAGNVSAAARRLGVHRRSLQRKLSRHPPPR
jgi:two-component system response regulator RegA